MANQLHRCARRRGSRQRPGSRRARVRRSQAGVGGRCRPRPRLPEAQVSTGRWRSAGPAADDGSTVVAVALARRERSTPAADAGLRPANTGTPTCLGVAGNLAGGRSGEVDGHGPHVSLLVRLSSEWPSSCQRPMAHSRLERRFRYGTTCDPRRPRPGQSRSPGESRYGHSRRGPPPGSVRDDELGRHRCSDHRAHRCDGRPLSPCPLSPW